MDNSKPECCEQLKTIIHFLKESKFKGYFFSVLKNTPSINNDSQIVTRHNSQFFSYIDSLTEREAATFLMSNQLGISEMKEMMCEKFGEDSFEETLKVISEELSLLELDEDEFD